MSTLTIRTCQLSDLESCPEFEQLIADYAAESAIDGFPHPRPQIDIYRELEAVGVIHVLSASVGDVLVGFLGLVCSVNPHYGFPIAVTESYFVTESARGTGAGLQLLKKAEELAKSLGAVAFMVSAPSNGRLAKVMPRIGYDETNRVFMRSLV